MKGYIGRYSYGTACNRQLIFPSAANRMISVDIETGIVALGEELPGSYGDAKKKLLYYSHAIHIGESSILFVPCNQNKFLIYDLRNGKQSFFEIDIPRLSEKDIRFWEYWLDDGILYLFPWQGSHVLCIFLDTMSVKISEFNLSDKTMPAEIGRKAKYDERTLLLASWIQNRIVKYDLETMEYKVIPLENESDEKGFRDIAVHNDAVYVVNHKYHVFQYDIGSFKLSGQHNVLEAYGLVKELENGLCFVPAFEEDYVLYDSRKNVFVRTPLPEKCYPDEDILSSERDSDNSNSHIIETTNSFYIMKTYGNIVSRICKATGKISFIPLKFSEDTVKQIYEECAICTEGQMAFCGSGLSVKVDLRDYIRHIQAADKKKRKTVEECSIGGKIYESVKV